GGINISYEGFSDVAQIGVAPFYNSVINIPRGSGYVGINKASPQYELDVNGKIGAQHYVYLNASAGGDGFYMLGPLGSYAAQLWASGSNGGYLGLSNGTTFTTVLSPYSDTSYFLDQNVGIGTNSPSYPLHVVGDVKIGNVAGDNKKLYFGDASYVYVGEGPSDDNLYLYGNNRVAFATASTDRLIIDSSGNIAIGTSSITVPTVLKVKNTNNNNAQIEVMNANNNNAIMMANWNNGNAVFGTTNNTDVAFRTDNTDRMTIKTSTGRVGIGTSGPAQLLEVEGANPRILVDSTSGNSELNLAVPTYGTWAMYHNSGDGSLRFYKSGDRFWVTSGGELYSSALANAAGTYYMMYNTGSGRITYTSSSARYKKNIRDIEVATSDVFDLKPRSFEYNNNTGSENVTDFGLIAEEVADVLPEMVLYDDEGRPSNVKYDRLAILLLVELNKTRSELDATRQELCTYNAEYSWCQTD
ncbi:tail fiber domain-containing protein, partial [Candidatus Woesearchaeota archaeon]|nr:tail fiber domain-containing protein [Candidatus Woesearchaeota archaeon]